MRKHFFTIYNYFNCSVFIILIQWLRQGFNEILFEFIVDRLKSYFWAFISFYLWFNNIDNILFINGNLSTFAIVKLFD